MLVRNPHQNGGDIFAWRLGETAVKVIANYEEYIRALSGGRFLAVRDDGYSILSFDESDIAGL